VFMNIAHVHPCPIFVSKSEKGGAKPLEPQGIALIRQVLPKHIISV